MQYLARAILVLVFVFLLFGCSVATADAPHTTPLILENSDSGSAVLSVPTLAPISTTLTPPAPSPSANSVHLDTETTPHLTAERRVSQRLNFPPVTPEAMTRAAPPRQPFEGAELYVHLPPQAQARQPLRVFVALHGMGNRGDAFSQNLIKIAEANNWVLVAPTFHYGDYLDLEQLRQDDIQLSRRLLDTLEVLPQRLNLKLYRQVLIYGYSRGAQLGHRFTYFYPERVKSIAVLSAGAYTMPTEKTVTNRGTPTVVPFPYGVGDLQECVGKPINWQALRRVSFWVGVGERDTHPQDVARAFDPYGGPTRVERAQSFQQALQSIGIKVYLVIFPNVSHELTAEMRSHALQFLRDEEIANPLDD